MGNPVNILVGAGSVEVNDSDIGFTTGGVTLRLIRNMWHRPNVDGLGYSESVKLNETFMVATQLTEATINNLIRAWDLQVSDLQEAGYTSYRFGGHSDVSVHSVTFKGQAPGVNKKREVSFYKCSAIEFGELQHSKEQETVIPIVLQVFADTSKNSNYSMGFIRDET